MAGKIRPESREKAKKRRLPEWPPRDLSFLTEDDAVETMERIERIRVEQQKERQRLRDWKDSSSNFNPQPYIEQFDAGQQAIKDELLKLSIQSISTFAGAGSATEVLQLGLNMKNAGIDGRELEELLRRIFRVQSTQVFLQQSNLKEQHRDAILERFIAQQFPVHDGPRTPKEVNVSKAARVRALTNNGNK